jgi:hypothetical protein
MKRTSVTDVRDMETDYYSRMLPEREPPVEALGGIFAGVAVAFAVAGLVIWPVLFGTAGVAFGGAGLAMARSRGAAQRFGFCFAIASVCWLLGLILATVRKSAMWP